MTLPPIERSRIVDEARRWVGVPYLHQGRNRFGVDCVGLILVVAWALGRSEYDVKGYGRTPHAGFLKAEADRLMEPIAVDARQPGDVLLMRFRREPQHLAFVSDRGMIHAYAGAKAVVETSLPREWLDRVVGAYAWPGAV